VPTAAEIVRKSVLAAECVLGSSSRRVGHTSSVMRVDPEEAERIYRSFPESIRRQCLRRSKPEVWLNYDDPELLEAAIELEEQLNALARAEFQSAGQSSPSSPF
jgi:hypothetical protein